MKEDYKEQYLKEDYIVKDDVFEAEKEELICPICEELMIVPMECSVCQNLYCQKCIEKWKKKGGNCPHHCTNSTFKIIIEKKRAISKIKFKCIKGCGAQILFKDIVSHYNSECIKRKKTMTLIDKKDIKKYTDKKRINYFTLITLGISTVGKTSLIKT